MNVRPAGGQQLQIRRVEPAGLGLAQPDLDHDARLAQQTAPLPATWGKGSAMAATTRATPARRTASVQGGVLPK